MSPIFPKMSFRAFLKSRIQSRIILLHVSQSVQSLSHVWLFSILWTGARQASLSITNSRSLLKLMSIESVMPSNHLILYCPLLLLPSIFSSIRVFSNESVLHIRWPNTGLSASASVLPMNIQDWFPLGRTGWISLQSKALQESFLIPQFKSINSSVLSPLYSSTLTSIHDYWKNIAFTIWTFVSKVMSLIFIMLSRLVVDFLPRIIF